MENTEKLANSKEVIAYIAERFPKCFTVEGEAKPLKIGIFQDLATRLDGDPKVSKTQLRAALRQYTSSWRYLHSVKPGASRVDLDGNACGELEQEHIDHAAQALAESKARAAERRKQQQAKKAESQAKNGEKAPAKGKKAAAQSAKGRTSKPKPAKMTKKESEPRRELSANDVVVGKYVNVNMGNGNLPATIVEINKDEVRVRLTNGLTMLVKAEHLSA